MIILETPKMIYHLGNFPKVLCSKSFIFNIYKTKNKLVFESFLSKIKG